MMKKVTVSKLQIAQAKECSRRADRYAKGIEAIIDMCEIVLPISQYNKMPDEFKSIHKRDMNTVIQDLRAMCEDACWLSLCKKQRATELEDERAKQLEEK